MLHHIKSTLTRFRQEERGAMTTEAVIILPVLIWWLLGSLVFFDAYQARSINLKASYTISDLVSRNTEGKIATTDIVGLDKLFTYLTSGHGTDGALRITMVYCSENCDTEARTLRRDWSYATGGKAELSDGDIARYKDAVPQAPQGERLIMVETYMTYEPVFNVGLDDSGYQNTVLTRPRFTPTICLTGYTCE